MRDSDCVVTKAHLGLVENRLLDLVRWCGRFDASRWERSLEDGTRRLARGAGFARRRCREGSRLTPRLVRHVEEGYQFFSHTSSTG